MKNVPIKTWKARPPENRASGCIGAALQTLSILKAHGEFSAKVDFVMDNIQNNTYH